MNAPFIHADIFGLDVAMVMALFLGAGFGFSLERGGFGSARKLAAQFYLHDMTVFKVMFTAILTAMVGLFGLTKLGFVNLDLVYINETYIWPQLVGGFLLGAGFIISGYCPGTSIVASASGKLDGMVALVGVVTGFFIFGAAYTPAVQAFHTSGYFGRVLLSDLLGIDATLLALLITAGAIGCFFFAHWVERRFKHLSTEISPTYVPRLRYATFGLLLAAALLFAVPFGPHTPEVQASVELQNMHSITAARHIVEDTPGFVLLDVRDEVDPDQQIPQALPVPRGENGEVQWNSILSKHNTYCLLTDSGDLPENAAIPPGFTVFMLEGGWKAWKKAILTKPRLPEPATSQERQHFEIRAALHAYFTGVEIERPKLKALPPVMKSSGKKKKPAGGC